MPSSSGVPVRHEKLFCRKIDPGPNRWDDGTTYHVFVVLYNEGLPALTIESGQTIVNELGKTISLLATLLVAISPVPEL